MSTSTLRIPADTEQVRVARLVAATAARRAGVAEDDVEDVRLAVGEAVGRAVLRHLEAEVEEPVLVELSDEVDEFTVVVRDDAGAQESDSDFAMAVITGLVPSALLSGHSVTMTWAL